MKLYHFSLIFLVFFGGLIVMEQKDELTTRLREGTQRVEYDCLVAAVNAAAGCYFSMEGKMEGKEGKEILLKNTETVFFQTLSVLHEKNADETGIEAMQTTIPLLAVFGEDVFYIYQNGSGGKLGWSEYAYEADGRIPEKFFLLAGEAVDESRKQFGITRSKSEVSEYFAGIWEKELSRDCVFAIYVPEGVKLSEKEDEVFLYAAAKYVAETYLVTQDMYCHLPSCASAIEKKVVSVFGTQKEAAKYGAEPCPFCLLWEDENTGS